MTKTLEPVSIENTLRLVLGELTLDAAAAATDRKPGYLHNMTDPDKRELLSVRDLELLDLAHHAKYGRGFLLYQALGRRLECAMAEQFADAAAIGAITADVARESGQAVAALVLAQLPGADRHQIEAALREVEEADQAMDAAIPVLRKALEHQRDGPPRSPT